MYVHDAFVYVAINFIFSHIHIASCIVQFNIDSLTICSENYYTCYVKKLDNYALGYVFCLFGKEY